ncbi:D-glycero-beta-D-manno-heptose-7-phosphate kinase [Leptospira borgpetersenii]|uniref:D-glycero-beta-D-manno-heptose-7-phosphate kinase n=1 Tax=Leptospira borgpetersenii TaxID=174 RepID=UPI000774D003|nr:D-glycero-beta-D-manno-heptose-7-phosphate kinase [Leptospira borgpetersenii]MBE8401382.1 D-glycero-beta-D-manno-heptose-7-phosphate kinase [Leptospira borgpetersenii serovar Tarassovi]MBE8404388.1 D-glycero-beta-D-manno-heptose-7-phosphate kinase [Leptospira borgpetersenii serovar Tarassovi]MBE8407541.1 D-glycero-beta-D-manno-heptose-7-phosphate kinase [Leptospira borgpetersenii serovar Tarassovi]MBE8413818.1 D-glycero-beta-D-manno-heptose-7-phosphate kinase [Leptospira borgpetersenii serov
MYYLNRDRFLTSTTRLKDLKIIVIGDFILDEYLIGEVNRISPEAPVPVVWVRKEKITLGGAGNVVKNLSSLGVKSIVLGRVGNDEKAKSLSKLLMNENTDESQNFLIESEEIPTILKTRVIAGHQQVCRIDKEELKPINQKEEELLLEAFLERIDFVDAVILSDYDKGTLTPRIIREVSKICSDKKKIVTVDPQVSHFFLYQGVSILTPNHHEAGRAIGRKLENDSEILNAAREISEKLSCFSLMITRGEKGMSLYLSSQKEIYHIPTAAREVFDVTGAGDTVISAYTAYYAAGLSELDASVVANAAAGVVIAKLGAETVTSEELDFSLQSMGSFQK